MVSYATFRLVEACSGTGDLLRGNDWLRRVAYRFSRYQGMMPSGLPIPNLHRIEGSIDAGDGNDTAGIAGDDLTLRLEDGRAVRIAVGCDGGIYAEGHGPGRGCSCC